MVILSLCVKKDHLYGLPTLLIKLLVNITAVFYKFTFMCYSES